MPDILVKNQVFYNPVDYVLKKLGGTWRTPVLWRLRQHPKRYGELQQSIEHISQKMLTQTLKQLEADGFVSRQVFAEVPPHTEYSLTEKGQKAVEIVATLREFGIELMLANGIDYEALVKGKHSKREKK